MKLFINIENIKEVCGIYSIQNIHNQKRYIGQSKNIKKRVLSHHVYDYNNKKHECYNNKFYQALRKYGLENFKIEILEECSIEELNDKEIYWINFYDTYKNGYNSTLGGNNFSPKIFSKETELKRENTREKNNSLKSENHPRAKLKNDEIILIRQRYIDGEDVKNIYEDFKHLYSIETFKRIVFGETYKDVGNIPSKNQIRYTNKNKTLGKLSKESVLGIKNDYKTGLYSYKDLSEKYKTSISTVGKIINNQLYKNI